MNVQRATIYIDGMTCRSCESRVAAALREVKGVLRAEARLDGGNAEVEFDPGLTDRRALEAAVEKAGYAVRAGLGSGTAPSLGIGVLLVGAYLAASASGAFSSLPKVDASVGYATLFLIGLLTSIHCAAMCGGISLSQSVKAPGAAGTGGSALKRLSPGLLYNAGKVLSYAVIGGIVGSLGSALSFSPAAKGAITAVAGFFMLALGLRMLGLLKGIPRLPNPLPARLRNAWTALASGIRGRGPFIVGILNGLMPCGPLQAMQLYALGAGSFLAGAFSMLAFSLGTVPLMLAFSLTAALLPRKFVPVMAKAGAVLVIFLGALSLGRAAALAGIALPAPLALSRNAKPIASAESPAGSAILAADKPAAAKGPLKATVSGGVQTVTTVFRNGVYAPLAAQAGIPLKWTIRIKAEDITGCDSPMVVPAYGIQKELKPGDNLVEFTPKKEGVISYSCWMGMVWSRIDVVKDLSAALPQSAPLQGQAGGCCGAAPRTAI